MSTTPRPKRSFTLAGVAVIGVLAGCGGSTTNPAPVPVSPTVTSVTVSGAGSLTTGQSSQLSAVANLSNGTQQSCTSSATWQSSNTSVVTISSGGVATGVGVGSAEIRATYQGVTGAAPVSVAAQTFVLSGTVRDGSSGAPLAGARVEVEHGTNTGRSASTDGGGAYRLAGLSPGTLDIRISKPEYEDEYRTGLSLVSDRVMDFSLARATQPIPPIPAPSTCSYGLTSPKSVAFGYGGGSGTATFTLTGGSCTWVASSSNPAWLTVVDTSGTGNIVIRFTVATNTSASPRDGRIEVRWPGPQVGENILITQAGVSAQQLPNVSGTWSLARSGETPATAYRNFTVTLTQSEEALAGSILPLGSSTSTPIRWGTVSTAGRVTFGSESAYWNNGNDGYFSLTLDPTHNHMTGGCNTPSTCSSATATRVR